MKKIIEKLDVFGRGIIYEDNKIGFLMTKPEKNIDRGTSTKSKTTGDFNKTMNNNIFYY